MFGFKKDIKKNLLIEGWRGINQSFSMVNQYQLLNLLRQNKFNLFHRDMPFYDSSWDKSKNINGFSASENKKLSTLKDIGSRKADIIYRVDFPYRFYGANAEKIFCFGTSEFQVIEHVYGGAENSLAYSNNSVNVITCSHWSREGFLAYGFKDENVIVIPLGVDPAIYKPFDEESRLRARVKLGISPDDFVFLHVGGVAWNKGIDKLILAFSEIRRKHKFAKLIIKDQRNLYGMTAEYVMSIVQKDSPSVFSSEILESIRVIPENLNVGQLCELYNACDAYVAPYRAEGFGLTPLEAAACGVPIALTAGGATDEYFSESFAIKIEGDRREKNNKHFIEPRLESVISAMLDLIEKRTPAINQSKALRYINDNFSWSSLTARLANTFLS